MKRFEKFSFNPRTCREQLNDFKDLLVNIELSEQEHILPFFRERKHLSAFIASYFTYVANFDRLAYEYDLFGDFTCDLAIGDSDTGHYFLVEFEDAKPSSLFVRRGKKTTPEWSPRFEHGFSQVLDWFWKLSDMRGTAEFRSRFGDNFAGYEGMLIIGRSDGLDYKGQDRLKWRRGHVVADSKHVHCVTYDELYQHLDSRLRLYEAAYLAGR